MKDKIAQDMHLRIQLYEEDDSEENDGHVLMTDGDIMKSVRMKRNSAIFDPKVSSMIVQNPASSSVVEEEHLVTDSQ